MKLNAKQRKYLKSLAHSLKPVITVGDKGLTPALIEELNTTLTRHELIKVKIRSSGRALRDAIIDELIGSCGAELVGRIGNIASLYKARDDKPRISLP